MHVKTVFSIEDDRHTRFIEKLSFDSAPACTC